MDFIFLAIPVIFGIVSVYLANRAVSHGCKRKKALYMQIASFCVIFIACFLCPMVAGAAETTEAATEAAAGAMGMGYLAAAIATGLSCIGGGVAVAYAAPAAIGATSEDSKNFGKSLIFVALGEGVALYGMLVSILILSKLG
ncbi:MAG: ATP synthase subunit C [Acutalibacteraceae bacterium]|nr:hypothetical protein [Clostridia bacterium]MEE3450135.1 ATP synthase subunit C [Acutalibacteraceae bacterium]